MARGLALAALAAALAAWPLVAPAERADELDEDGEAAPLGPDRTAWLVLEGALGVNGVTDDEVLGPVEMGAYPLLGFGLAAYARPLAFLSAGLQLYYGGLLAHSERREPGAAGFLAVTAFSRAQYAFGRLEPWVGLGLGYAQAHAGATGPRAADEGSLSLHALAVDLSAGLAVEVLDGLAVGFFARFVFGLWATGCHEFPSWPFEVPEGSCEGIEPFFGGVLPRLPHLWVVGANVAYRLL